VEPILCPSCGNLITELPIDRCPACQLLLPRFITYTRILDEKTGLEKDPIKQKEAELAKQYRHLFEHEFPKYDWIPPSETPLTPERREEFSLPDMINRVDDLFFDTIPPPTIDTPRITDSPTYFALKIVLLGEEESGKETLVSRFTENTFSPDYKQVTGASFAVKDLSVHNHKVKLVIWDVNGQPAFRQVRRHYISGAHGALLVFDVTNPNTFMTLHQYITDYQRLVPHSPITLVGNHPDPTKDPAVPFDAIQKFAHRWNIPYYETNPITGQHITTAFANLAERALERALTQTQSK
jgi:small GTP-binding protein